jgi:2-methylisocitrate lyase-like PEP mutase family enzyme
LVKAVSPKPVNVLVGSELATVAELADVGVRRISVGGVLARAAWTGFLQAAKEIAEHGTFGSLGRALPFAEDQPIVWLRMTRIRIAILAGAKIDG